MSTRHSVSHLFRFQSSSVLICLGKQQMMAQSFECLLPTEETRMEFLAPGLIQVQQKISESESYTEVGDNEEKRQREGEPSTGSLPEKDTSLVWVQAKTWSNQVSGRDQLLRS